MWTWLVFDSDRWDDVTAHWPIALAMGSYVAGSTPMGGGKVGFRILVLLFGPQRLWAAILALPCSPSA